MRQRAPLPVPFDVRLMNATATTLFLAVGLMVLGALGWYVVRNPFFALGHIVVQGDVAHSSAATLRAHVAPRLSGNFFTVDLARAREAFEDIPWVRQATVRRVFPNRLSVRLQEHQAVAFWGEEGNSTLVNSFGEVFEANPDEAPDDLPRLAGPDAQSALVLSTWRALAPLFEGVGLPLAGLQLSGRGSWQAVADGGAEIELGRGSTQDLLARAERFTRTIGEAAARYGRQPDALVSADLRHADGYAIRLRGVSTVGADARKKN